MFLHGIEATHVVIAFLSCVDNPPIGLIFDVCPSSFLIDMIWISPHVRRYCVEDNLAADYGRHSLLKCIGPGLVIEKHHWVMILMVKLRFERRESLCGFLEIVIPGKHEDSRILSNDRCIVV
jgi:hypothetical protein